MIIKHSHKYPVRLSMSIPFAITSRHPPVAFVSWHHAFSIPTSHKPKQHLRRYRNARIRYTCNNTTLPKHPSGCIQPKSGLAPQAKWRSGSRQAYNCMLCSALFLYIACYKAIMNHS